MQDATVADPKGDVRRLVVLAVRDQVARRELPLVHLDSGRLLLVSVAGHEPPEPAISHVDESGTVDPALRQAAPEVGRAEITARLADGVPAHARELVLPHPAGVVVGGPDACPTVASLLDLHRLAAEELRHPLGLLAWLGADWGHLDGTEHVHAGRV